MRLFRLGHPGGGTRLFLTYAVASLLALLALGGLLAQGYQRDGVKRGLEQGRAQAAVIEEMAVAPALRGADLRDGLTRVEQQRLQSATDLAIFRGSVVRLRLRAFDGVVVFSDDGAVDGALPVSDPAFRAAALGATDAAIMDGGAPGKTIRVLQPVVSNASGRSVGVLEIYLPYDTVAAEIQATTRRTYWRLGAGLGLMYLVLAAISWSTTRRLRQHAAQAAHDALHDPLTGLPNRELFRRRVDELTRSRAEGAVVLVDLDRFKQVNDGLGHHAGDMLLQQVAERLREGLRTDDTVARLGGDEFGLLLAGMGDPGAAHSLLQKVRDDLSRDLLLDGVPVTIDASFGVALHPSDGADLESLLRRADAAMYQAKRGLAGVVVYDPAHAPAPTTDLSTHRDMRRALEDGDLLLHYQPKIDLDTGSTTCLEALLRWQHPVRGLLVPAQFLPTVDQSSLMDALTHWVLTRALADCSAWSEQGESWGVAVNVSVRNLESAGFADTVARLLQHAGVHPSRLHLEVTETALAMDARTVESTLGALASMGVGLALDDFGTGYASLSRLRSLALSEVKIDRAFVAGIEARAGDREVIAALIQMAHGLGLSVTAEGVELATTGDWLRSAGCDSAQGYHFARPAPWAELRNAIVDTSSCPGA